VPKIIVSDKALREMVREAFNNTGWSGEENSPVVTVNPITDPACAVVDPVNPSYTPQDKTEFGVAMQQLVKNLPDSDMPGVFDAVKSALDKRSERDEIDAANQAAMVAGSQEAIDAAGEGGSNPDKNDKHEGKTMSTDNKIEEQLRLKIRKVIAQLVSEAPEVKKIPIGVHGGEYMARHEKTKAALQKSLGRAADTLDAPEPDLPDEEAGEEGDEEDDAPKVPKHAHQAIGAQGAVGAASFEDIAKELGFSVSGAKQAVDKTMLRFKFLYALPEDEREIMVLNAMNDYIDMMNKTGELTAADVQLLKDHPDIVRELDGFREYFHNNVRRAMKAQPEDVESPMGEGDELDEDDEVISMRSAAEPEPGSPKPPSPPHASTKSTGAKSAKMSSGKDATVDWGGFDESVRVSSPLLVEAAAIVMSDRKGPYVIADGVEARPGNPNQTQYRAGSRVNVHRRGKKGVFIVEMPNGERWTNMKLQEAPKAKNAPKSKKCKNCGAVWPAGGTGKQCKGCGQKLTEAPFPGRGRERIGGPGSEWDEGPDDRRSRSSNPAAKVRKHKEQNPSLYCPQCLWRTNGGPCPRHGGPVTFDEREQMQQDLGSHVHDPDIVADWMRKHGA
jgi:hypothetical protein